MFGGYFSGKLPCTEARDYASFLDVGGGEGVALVDAVYEGFVD